MADVLLAATLQGDSAVSAAARREVVFQNTGSGYKRSVTIDNTGNANDLTDYQVLVTLDTASLIAAGKMRSDCGDIRFRDSDGQTELPYWIESGINTTSTKIWVKVPSIPGSSTKTIFLCYGDLGLQSQSNGDAVFNFFDDFGGTSLNPDKWNLSGVTGYALSNGYLVVTYSEGDGNLLTTKSPLSLNSFVVEYAINDSNDARVNIYCSQCPIKRSADGGDWYSLLVPWEGGDSRIDWFTGGTRRGNVITGAPKYTTYKGTLKANYTGASSQYVTLTTNQGTIFNNILLNKFSVTNTYLSLSKDGTATAYFDYVYVRKYTSPEPPAMIGEETVITQKLTLSGGSSLSARTSVERALAALLQGDSTFTPHGLYTLLEATLQGDSAMTANLKLILTLASVLRGDSTVTANATIERLLQALLQGGSKLTATAYTNAVIIVLRYLLKVADRVDYKLSVRDMAEFKLKVADLLEYMLKMRN